MVSSANAPLALNDFYIDLDNNGLSHVDRDIAREIFNSMEQDPDAAMAAIIDQLPPGGTKPDSVEDLEPSGKFDLVFVGNKSQFPSITVSSNLHKIRWR